MSPSLPSSISREVVLDVELPRARDVTRVQVRRISVPPDTAVGPHVHNGPVFGSIERGSVVYQIDGGEESVLQAGDVFYEPEATRIVRFDARSDGAMFLGYFPVGAGEEPELTPVD